MRPREVATSVCGIAGKLLRDFFSLDGLAFQDMPLSAGRKSRDLMADADLVLASSLQPGMAAMIPIGPGSVRKLLAVSPQGGVVYTN
jgi:hypothetical protein